MHFAVLGTGDVGKALAAGLVRHGHTVTIGTRDPAAVKFSAWRKINPEVKITNVNDAAKQAEIAILCTAWEGAKPTVESAIGGLTGKVVIDVTNPLDFSKGTPPSLSVAGHDSAGETVQRWLPKSHVVKCWNIVGNPYMIDPKLPQTPTMFIAGNDAKAKQTVTALLGEVGWSDTVDLGGIAASRYLEGLAMVWILTFFATGSGAHALGLVRAV